MSKDFKEVMTKHSDEELIKIVTLDRGSYQLVALEAAEEEIKKRNISIEHIEEVKTDLINSSTEENSFRQIEVASWKRYLHFFIDLVAFSILSALYGVILSPFITTRDETNLTIISYLIGAAAVFSYYIFMESNYQKTIGKFITKTNVVTTKGEKPTVRDIVIRTACRFIPFDGISFLFTSDGFHDRFSETTVIDDEIHNL